MSYENKEYILQFFEGVHEKDNKAELIEVYQKAKVFDRIRKILDEITNDEKVLMDARNDEFAAGKISAYENIEILMDDYKYIYKKYESGESDA